MDASESITATPNTLMNQAPKTVMEYVRALKAEMGEEWTNQNPEAFATLVHAASIDYAGSVISKELHNIAAWITDALTGVAKA